MKIEYTPHNHAYRVHDTAINRTTVVTVRGNKTNHDAITEAIAQAIYKRIIFS